MEVPGHRQKQNGERQFLKPSSKHSVVSNKKDAHAAVHGAAQTSSRSSERKENRCPSVYRKIRKDGICNKSSTDTEAEDDSMNEEASELDDWRDSDDEICDTQKLLTLKRKDFFTWKEEPMRRVDLEQDGGEDQPVSGPVSSEQRLEVAGVLQLLIVGRCIYQPSKHRSGYVLYVSPVSGNTAGLPHTVLNTTNETFTVVFPPSTDRTHPEMEKPTCIPDEAWHRIWADIEPVTQFHNMHAVLEIDPHHECLSAAQFVHDHPHAEEDIDVLGGLILFELQDTTCMHPVYLGNRFIDKLPTPLEMQNHDIREMPSNELTRLVQSACEARNFKMFEGESDGDDESAGGSDTQARDRAAADSDGNTSQSNGSAHSSEAQDSGGHSDGLGGVSAVGSSSDDSSSDSESNESDSGSQSESELASISAANGGGSLAVSARNGNTDLAARNTVDPLASDGESEMSEASDSSDDEADELHRDPRYVGDSTNFELDYAYELEKRRQERESNDSV